MRAPPAAGHRVQCRERDAGGGFRGQPAPGLRLQVHTRSPGGPPSRSPAPPPGYSSPFMRTPRAAAAAAGAAAVAVRPDWLAAGAPALSHGPRRVRLTGGAAGAALAHGQANRGARGGAGRWLSPGWCRGAAPYSCPPPAHRRPRPPAELPRSRRTAAGQGRGAACLYLRSSRLHAAANTRSEAPIGQSPRLPGASAPPLPHLPASPALPLSLGRGAAWERDG